MPRLIEQIHPKHAENPASHPNVKAKLAKNPAAAEVMIPDGGGLYLRWRPTGSTWVFLYGPATARRKALLGPIEDHTLKAAREWASEHRGNVRQGKADPQHEEQAKRAAVTLTGEQTFGALLDAYVADLKRHGRPSAGRAANYVKNTPQSLRSIPAKFIRREVLMAEVRRKFELGHEPTAARWMAIWRAAFNRAIGAKDDPTVGTELLAFGIEANPLARMRNIDRHGQRVAKRGALTLPQLRRYVELLLAHPSASKAPGAYDRDGRDLALLGVMLGGQRYEQLALATVELEPMTGLPALQLVDKKNDDRPNVLPIGVAALQVLEARDWQPFVSNREPRSAAIDASHVARSVAHAMAVEGVEHFSLRNVRSSCNTLLGMLGVPRDHKNQLQSNNLHGVDLKHYDKWGYLKEKRAALAKLEKALAPATPVTPKRTANVVELKPAKTTARKAPAKVSPPAPARARR
jgi:hypothetical protein